MGSAHVKGARLKWKSGKGDATLYSMHAFFTRLIWSFCKLPSIRAAYYQMFRGWQLQNDAKNPMRLDSGVRFRL